MHPQPGQQLPDFELIASDARPVRAGSYRHERNLVLACVARCSSDACRHFLNDLARDYPRLVQAQAEVLVVLQGGRAAAEALRRQLGLPFPVLADTDGLVHRMFDLELPEGGNLAAVYVTDRYSEIQAVYRIGASDAFPPAEEIASELEFLEIQCPE